MASEGHKDLEHRIEERSDGFYVVRGPLEGLFWHGGLINGQMLDQYAS